MWLCHSIIRAAVGCTPIAHRIFLSGVDSQGLLLLKLKAGRQAEGLVFWLFECWGWYGFLPLTAAPQVIRSQSVSALLMTIEKFHGISVSALPERLKSFEVAMIFAFLNNPWTVYYFTPSQCKLWSDLFFLPPHVGNHTSFFSYSRHLC